MTEPLVDFTEDRHTYCWSSMGIQVVVDSFHENRERELYATVAVHDLPKNGEEPNYFIRGRHNLSAPTQADRLAALLAAKCREINKEAWSAMLGQVVMSSQRYWERGEPPVNVLAARPLDHHFLLYPILPFGQVCMIFADGESGKSLLADTFGLALQLGMPLPYPLEAIKQEVPYLYLDWESDAAEHRERVEWLARGWGFDPAEFPAIYHMSMGRRLVDDLPRIRDAIRKTRAQLLVVDSIAAACGGIELKEADAAIRTLTALRLLSPVTSLVLAHTSKENAARESGKGSAYGSVFFRNYVRRSWELRSHKKTETGWLGMGLFQDKANWRPGINEVGLQFAFDNERESVTVRGYDLSCDPMLSSHGTVELRIESQLIANDNRPMLVSDLAENTGLKEATIKTTLSRAPEKFANTSTVRNAPGLWVLRNPKEAS